MNGCPGVSASAFVCIRGVWNQIFADWVSCRVARRLMCVLVRSLQCRPHQHLCRRLPHRSCRCLLGPLSTRTYARLSRDAWMGMLHPAPLLAIPADYCLAIARGLLACCMLVVCLYALVLGACFSCCAQSCSSSSTSFAALSHSVVSPRT